MEPLITPSEGLATSLPFDVSLNVSSEALGEERLVSARLGVASGLFMALRHKHAPTAAHSLRVAVGCSSWAFVLGMHPEERDELEVAALLHDVGKIGAPDAVLLKPGPLVRDEARLMQRYRRSGVDILAACCVSANVLEMVRHSAGVFPAESEERGDVGPVPLGAKMLAIVDAFDSMTCDQVYRRAMSRERALHELFRHSGTQFDPELVKSFSELRLTSQLQRKVVGNWLQTIDSRQVNRFWRHSAVVSTPATASSDPHLAFQQKLLDNMYDAVIFVDCNMEIVFWNRGAERLTGISAESVLNSTWSPGLIGMRDEREGGWGDMECPIGYCMTTGIQSLRRLLVANRNRRPIAVDAQTIPVVGKDGFLHGAAMLLHDVSGEASLEEQCLNLQEKATQDPLTKIANRAEFDQSYPRIVQAHQQRGVACSLVICDIDHFKSINDTFGHQAGDEVLRAFGQLLKGECRPGDLVARYGGEEFVVVCADCSSVAAGRRAEQLRKAVSELPQAAINGRAITASFGVTEIQPGDSPDSLLRRADRALLDAKQAGRNAVVQLGSGGGEIIDESPLSVSTPPVGELCLERRLATAVPLNIAVEKLRGFVVDHGAEVLSINGNRLELQIDVGRKSPARRRSDHPVPFLLELTLAEQRRGSVPTPGHSRRSHTQVNVLIRLKRSRDQKVASVERQATSILEALKSYLMAGDDVSSTEMGPVRPAANILMPWLKSL
jgi:diguanylate cyclase (GGDEF)-like protein